MSVSEFRKFSAQRRAQGSLGRFLRPAHLNGATFFVDDLQSIKGIGKADLALAIRHQFQSFGIEGINYSICFSARANYFADTKGPADPVPRFYTKLYLEPFTVKETNESIRSAFGTSPDTTARIAAWHHGKTLGHPYFVAFVRRHLAKIESEIHPDHLEAIWPAILEQLGRETFHSEVSRLSTKELDLLRQFANLGGGELPSHSLARKFQREYFVRLVEKRLLIRTIRGRYKLYHPLFREFLRQTK